MKHSLTKTIVYLLGLSIFAYGAVAVKKISFVNQTKCIKCGTCFKVCPSKAIVKTMKDTTIVSCVVDPKKCIGCGKCNKSCPVKAITLVDPRDPMLKAEKAGPQGKAVTEEKPAPKKEKTAAAE
jgi:ferredoxin